MLLEKNSILVASALCIDPLRGFLLRELSRKAGLSTTATKSALSELTKAGIATSKPSGHGNYPTYSANRDDLRFRRFAKARTVELLYESGLSEYLFEECQPSAIVLFGSAGRGEDVAGSDLDLYVQARERKLAGLEKFEKALGRNIQILFEKDFGNIGKELRNNIINGTIIRGYLKVF
jgi:predicted nucleotidyltransferase